LREAAQYRSHFNFGTKKQRSQAEVRCFAASRPQSKEKGGQVATFIVFEISQRDSFFRNSICRGEK
jgi:hypothetical protein